MHPPSPPKFLHNNWTWRQRLEYEIREGGEEPKKEDTDENKMEGGKEEKKGKVYRPLRQKQS
jgi:hypothetical protein